MFRVAFSLVAVAIGAAAVCATTLTAAPTPSRALLIAIEGPGEHTIVIADPATMKVVANVPLTALPYNIAVSDDGKFAYVACGNFGKGKSADDRASDEGTVAQSEDYISIIDLIAQKEVRRVNTGLGSRIWGIVFVQGKVYYTAEGYKAVGRYDPGTDKIDWMQGTGEAHTHLLVTTKDAKQIFTVNTSSNSVSAIVPWDDPTAYNPPPQKVITIPVGQAPEGIDISPDERELWAINKGSEILSRPGELSIIDVATRKVTEMVDLKTQVPIRIRFTPDGKRALITDEFDGKMLVLETSTRKEIKRIQVVEKTQDFKILNENTAIQNGVAIIPKSMLHELLVTPDGSRAYVALMGDSGVAVVDLKTLEVTGRISTSTGNVLAGMAWAVRR
jgi:YVTN family beta-propeller protein